MAVKDLLQVNDIKLFNGKTHHLKNYRWKRKKEKAT